MKRLKKSHEYMYKITHVGELLLAIVILIAIIISGVSLVLELTVFIHPFRHLSIHSISRQRALIGCGNRVRKNAL